MADKKLFGAEDDAARIKADKKRLKEDRKKQRCNIIVDR